MAIFVFSAPQSMKGSPFHLRSKKKSKLVDQCHGFLSLISSTSTFTRTQVDKSRQYKSSNKYKEKLQTYNEINGAIRRHFGKQMNKETKLRIHNITAKAALKFGSEAWVLKKIEEQRLEAAQMKFLRHLLGITKLDKEKNQCFRGNGSI